MNGGTQCYGPAPNSQTAETIVERFFNVPLADFGTMTFHGVGITDNGRYYPMNELPNERYTMKGCVGPDPRDPDRCAHDVHLNPLTDDHTLACTTAISSDPGDVPYDQLSVVYNADSASDLCAGFLPPPPGGGRGPMRGDINGDGNADALAFYDRGCDTQACYTSAFEWNGASSGISTPTQVWSSAPSGFTWANAKWVRGDFNGDGRSDAVAFYDLGCDSHGCYTAAYEWLGTSSGLVYQGQIWNSSPSGFTWASAKWISGDFNGDGKADALAFYDLGCDSQACYTAAYEWLGTSSGLSYQGQVWNSTPGGFTWANGNWIAGDFNGDGKDDAVAFYDLGCDSQACYTAAYEWLGTSSGIAAPTQVWSSAPGGFTWANAKWIAGDFNGDGRADAMAFYDRGCDSQACYTAAFEWLGTRGGLSAPTQVWSSAPGGFTWANTKWTAGDFNGDGKADALALYDRGCDSQACYTAAFEWTGTSSGLSAPTQVWSSAPGGFTWASIALPS
jgi:hypothetical protein